MQGPFQLNYIPRGLGFRSSCKYKGDFHALQRTMLLHWADFDHFTETIFAKFSYPSIRMDTGA